MAFYINCPPEAKLTRGISLTLNYYVEWWQLEYTEHAEKY